MAKVRRLYVGILTALALCKYCLAEWNTTSTSANPTVSHCHHHGNRDNCTELWNSHFSECPGELQNYCIHGDCRYIEEQKAPSCWCHSGFFGSRCEYVNLDWRIGEKRQIIIACIIAGLVILILVIVFICICSQRRYRPCWRRGRRREEPITEKLSMMATSAVHTTLAPDSTEPPNTHAV
ncbi:Probetacellulin Betacellulin [Channa argus]|uniref:Probetacellulin Betacellulin n=1 Tax=Channa argus TaxID=215402 RepID=A0A6G1QHQ2_CHAAH|nr:Probetacellulin Betacellulin [Channa argus]KAK2888167.1 hypothetical protein Q8A73_019615 [Channa argus]